MPASLPEWDAKHRAAAQGTPAEAASFVRELLPLLPLGPALDLACGTGRHTLLLAGRRRPITAGDRWGGGVGILGARARGSRYGGGRGGGGGAGGGLAEGMALGAGGPVRARRDASHVLG